MGMPVADILAHSPPFHLSLTSFSVITVEDEEGIVLALEQRDHICHIHLEIPILNLQKLILSINEEYPILEYPTMVPLFSDKSASLILPPML